MKFWNTKTPKIIICNDFPEIAIPNDPIVLFNGNKVLLCYETIPHNENYAIIEYSNIIEFKVTPINDEGLGKHPYAKYGLKFYSIHIIENTLETKRWSILGAKYWVYCFKDRTFEVIGCNYKIIELKCDRERLNDILSQYSRM